MLLLSTSMAMKVAGFFEAPQMTPVASRLIVQILHAITWTFPEGHWAFLRDGTRSIGDMTLVNFGQLESFRIHGADLGPPAGFCLWIFTCLRRGWGDRPEIGFDQIEPNSKRLSKDQSSSMLLRHLEPQPQKLLGPLHLLLEGPES